MRQRCVIRDGRYRGDVDFKGVLIGAVAVVDQGTVRGALGAGLRLSRRGAGRYTGGAGTRADGVKDIGLPSAGRSVETGHQLGDREADVARGQTFERHAIRIGETELDYRRPADGDAGDGADDGASLAYVHRRTRARSRGTCGAAGARRAGRTCGSRTSTAGSEERAEKYCGKARGQD